MWPLLGNAVYVSSGIQLIKHLIGKSVERTFNVRLTFKVRCDTVRQSSWDATESPTESIDAHYVAVFLRIITWMIKKNLCVHLDFVWRQKNVGKHLI